MVNMAENPHATRYLFGPNGYGLRKGEGYYSNTWIFFNQLSYGFTDNFTVGAGVIPLFCLPAPRRRSGSPPKFSIPVKKDVVNLGVGGLFATVLGGEDVGTFGIAYGQLTLGSRPKCQLRTGLRLCRQRMGQHADPEFQRGVQGRKTLCLFVETIFSTLAKTMSSCCRPADVILATDWLSMAH